MAERKNRSAATPAAPAPIITPIDSGTGGYGRAALYLSRRVTNRTTTVDLLSLAQGGYTASQLLDVLVDAHPDVSKALSDIVNVSMTALTLAAERGDGKYSESHDAWLASFVKRMSYDMAAGDDDITGHSLHSFVKQCIVSLAVRGAACAEIVVDRRAEPLYWLARDPGSVEFKQNDRTGAYRALWDDGSSKKPIDNGLVFYQAMDERIDDPYGVAPFFAALSVVFLQLRVLVDLAQVSKKMWPRVHIKVLADSLLKNMPAFVKTPQERKAYFEGYLAQLKKDYLDLQPDHGFVTTDAVDIGTVESKSGGMTFDIRPLVAVIDQQVVSALKSMPSLIGRSAGKTSTFAKAEIEVYRFFAQNVQKTIAQLVARLATTSLHLSGRRGYVYAQFAPPELRSETEIAQWQATQISNECNLVLLGVKTFDEMRMALRRGNGALPPMSDDAKKQALDWVVKIASKGSGAAERSGTSTADGDSTGGAAEQGAEDGDERALRLL